MNTERNIVFSMLAKMAFDSLPASSQESMERSLKIVQRNIFSLQLKHRLRKMRKPNDSNVYTLDVGTKYRAFLQVHNDWVEILDIVNHEAYKQFFSRSHA